jgi:hypothetical protein
MITESELTKIGQCLSDAKATFLTQIALIKEGVKNNEFFFLKMIQTKVPFLNLLPDSMLSKWGALILENLPHVKTYNGLVSLLKAFYGNNVEISFTQKRGVISVNIKGDLSALDHLISNQFERYVLQSGEEIILKGYGVLQGYKINEFLQNFVLAGVKFEDPNLNDSYKK